MSKKIIVATENDDKTECRVDENFIAAQNGGNVEIFPMCSFWWENGRGDTEPWLNMILQ